MNSRWVPAGSAVCSADIAAVADGADENARISNTC